MESPLMLQLQLLLCACMRSSNSYITLNARGSSRTAVCLLLTWRADKEGPGHDGMRAHMRCVNAANAWLYVLW